MQHWGKPYFYHFLKNLACKYDLEDWLFGHYFGRHIRQCQMQPIPYMSSETLHEPGRFCWTYGCESTSGLQAKLPTGINVPSGWHWWSSSVLKSRKSAIFY